jgi:formiminotetrahydrofolate cyclodeaminase
MAAVLAQTAITGAGYNVRINTLGIKDQEITRKILNDLESIETRATQFTAQLDNILKGRGGLPLP